MSNSFGFKKGMIDLKQIILIENIIAREILDSRGNPTVEVDVYTSGGYMGRASVPSGASTGEYEAVELRDGEKLRFMGKGVLNAVLNVNTIIKEQLIGLSVQDMTYIDNLLIELDATENKEKLGANAILAVSLATTRAAANALGVSLYNYIGGINAKNLPVPMMNILNGGAHANNNIDIQEFMIMPISARSFKDAVKMCSEVYHNLKILLSKDGHNTSVGDEGGFAPNLESNEKAIEYILNAIEKANYKQGDDFMLALDAASSEWYDKEKQTYTMPKTQKTYSKTQLADYYFELTSKYPIISIEDGFSENDFEGFKILTEKIGKTVQLVGDDLFVTNTKRLKMGIEKGVSNAILIKPNQIGTLTETLDAVEMAKKAGFGAIISHRSGETEDTTIADIAVATNCGQIKTGAPCRTDRTAKYNRLIRIEEELGALAIYEGMNVFYNINKKANA